MRVVVFVLAAISAALTPALLSAQWPPYPTAGVPRTPDGKPDLNAPAPRTADGKPDFSGVWEYVRSRDGQPASSAATPSGATPSAGTSAGLGPAPAAGTSQFFNIGTGLKGGLPFQPWAAELRKQRAANNNKDNPDAHCLPLGLMQLHTHPQPRKIIQTPGVIVILYEANGGVRQIFTDGRPLPRNDPQPWWYGYSTAKWDGDTLVVETNGFRDDVWLDVEGSPMTSAGKMTERIRRPSYGYLETEITVDDPKAYTKPWTVKVNHRIMLDTDLIEFVCQENEKDAPHLTGK
jgi:hypothetical protein